MSHATMIMLAVVLLLFVMWVFLVIAAAIAVL